MSKYFLTNVSGGTQRIPTGVAFVNTTSWIPTAALEPIIWTCIAKGTNYGNSNDNGIFASLSIIF